jgi:hypothetical protein
LAHGAYKTHRPNLAALRDAGRRGAGESGGFLAEPRAPPAMFRRPFRAKEGSGLDESTGFLAEPRAPVAIMRRPFGTSEGR